MKPGAGTYLARYGWAVLAVAMATGARLLLEPLVGERLPFMPFLVAVLLVAWGGGLGPALATVGLGMVALAWFFLPPRDSLAVHGWHGWLGLGLYLVVGAGVALLGGAMRARKQRAEEQSATLAQEREQLRITLASIGDAVVVTDAHGRLVSLNGSAQALTGWGEAEARGRPLADVCSLADEAAGRPFAHPLDWLLHHEHPAEPLVLTARDGSTRPISVSAAPIRADDGTMRGAVLVFRDVTEQRRSATVVAGQKRVLELLVQGAPMPDVLDGLCAIIEGQSQHQLLASVLLVDATGRHLRSAAGHRLPAAYLQAVDGLAIGPAVGSCGTAAYRAEPVIVADLATDPLWADFRELALGHGLRACWSTPIFSTLGKVLGTFAVYYRTPRRPTPEEVRLVDILTRTAGIAIERRQAAETLREADRRKDEFLATLAHELRNPLAPMRNALQIIQLAESDAAAVGQARAMMERQLRHMVRLVDDLLDVSRITRGKLELRKQRVDLVAVVRTALETSRPLIAAAGHELQIALPPQPVHVDADPVRLAQVFANLLNNAAKYTERGGRIGLTAERQGSDAVVAVRDTGLGIAPELLDRVFELFAQADDTREKAQGGLGIGLTLARRLTEMHGGSIQVHSDGPGCGSEFTVRLPAVPAAPAQADESAAATAGPRSCRRILVVDDNRDAAMSLALMLQLMGNEVRTAHDGLDGVQAADVFRPEVVLLDIGLPRLNGYEADRRLRAEPWGRDLILIAITGWGQEDDRRRSKEAGFNFHMVKPVEPTALEKLLTGLLTVS